MTTLLVLASAAWSQTAVHSYCSLDPLAPPMPAGAGGACYCVRHPDPYYGASGFPDWYGDVLGKLYSNPTVQSSSCFNVSGRIASMAAGFAKDEMEDVLIEMAEKFAHENPWAYKHHWEADELWDATEFPGCSPPPAQWERVSVNGYEITDGSGTTVAGLLTSGQTVTRVVARNGNPWNDDLFVLLNTGEVWILPGPHSGTVTWNPAP